MIKGLWNNVELVCGCHGDEIPVEKKIMTPKAGYKSMFYSCPRYYPENRMPDEKACVNHVNIEDFQKILDIICKKTEEQMIFGQNAVLQGFSFKVKDIDIKVISHTSEKIVISVCNKKAIA